VCDVPPDDDPSTASEPLVSLPESMRTAFKDPLGPVYRTVDDLLADAGSPIVAVGDVVTAHLHRAGRTPDVALVDGLTKRDAVDERTRETLATLPGRRVSVPNPAGTLSEALLVALRDAVPAVETGRGGRGATHAPDATAESPPEAESASDPETGSGSASGDAAAGDATREPVSDREPVTIDVDGEEDLAALPAIIATPVGGSVVYGQPDEGMVLVAVTPAARREAHALLSRMDGDPAAALELLGVDPDAT
jgi:hypothetical protein